MPDSPEVTRTGVHLPDPHVVVAGTQLTANGQTWECVHEGRHAFWEKQ